MRLIKSVRDLDPIPQRIHNGQRASQETCGKRLTFQVLHHQVIDRVLIGDCLANVVHRTDVRMADRSQRFGFAFEA
jgi:hypothetical protein